MDDNILLYGSTGAVFLLNFILLSKRRRIGLYSILIQIIYVAWFIYGIYFEAEGWDRLSWWLLFMIALFLHGITILCMLIYFFMVSRRVPNE